MIGQEKGQRATDSAGRDKSEILSTPGVSQADNYLERGWHCKHCHMELTQIEKVLYGDSCVFHTDTQAKPFSLLKKLYMAYLDWKIYNLLVRFKKKFQETSFYYLVSTLGLVGIQHIGAAYNIKLKKLLIEEIRRTIRDVSERTIHEFRTGSKQAGRNEEEGCESRSEKEEQANLGSESKGHAEISRLRNQLA